ncbi:MAG: HAMP domain-containing protein [Alphaproteobacteria bacterium]|nr:HAMP domain-containing protein [Alphaproteobacteria bacterium]
MGGFGAISLVTRTALAVALMGLAITAAVGATAFVVMRQNTVQILESAAASEVKTAAVRVETRLQALLERAQSLAGNIVVGNALVDTASRDVYLQPLLGALTQVQNAPIGIVLSDFEGKPLLSAGTPWLRLPASVGWMAQVSESGIPAARVDGLAGDDIRIAIAFPVLSPVSNAVEGVVAAHVSARTLLESLGAEEAKKYRLYAAERTAVNDPGMVSAVLNVSAVLRPLTLTLSTPINKKELDAALGALTVRFGAIGAVAIVLIVLVSIAIGRRVTEPLRRMADAAARIATTDSLPETFGIRGAGEIGELARAFDGMMARVKGAADSERQNRETRLQFLQQRLKDAIESVTDGVALFDARDKMVEFNRSYARLMIPAAGPAFKAGVRFEDLLRAIAGGGFYADMPSDWVERRTRQYRELAPSEYRAMTEKGERWMITRHFRTGDGGTFIVVTDITERKEAEETLLSAKLKAEAASRAKSEFVATVSHELRTPLTSIRGSLALIDGGVAGQLPDKAKGLVDMARRNTERLIAIVNDVLDVQKIEAGAIEFRMESIDLAALLKAAVETNAGYAGNLGVTLALGDMPGAPPLTVGDAGRLQQVMGNLISNAAKFSPSGGAVEVGLDRRGHKWRIVVADRGRGIPPGYRRKIFEKFVQVDSTDTRAVGGTGLGLSIVKAIVERHGGHIAFCARPGGGTVFFFTLPVGGRAASAVAE